MQTPQLPFNLQFPLARAHQIVEKTRIRQAMEDVFGQRMDDIEKNIKNGGSGVPTVYKKMMEGRTRQLLVSTQTLLDKLNRLSSNNDGGTESEELKKTKKQLADNIAELAKYKKEKDRREQAIKDLEDLINAISQNDDARVEGLIQKVDNTYNSLLTVPLENIWNNIQDLKKQITEKDQPAAQKASGITKTKSGPYEKLSREYRILQNEAKLLRQQLSHLPAGKTVEELTEELQQAKSTLAGQAAAAQGEKKEKENQLKTEIETLRSRLQKLPQNETVDSIVQKLNEANNKVQDLKSNNSDYKLQVDSLNVEIAALRSAYTTQSEQAQNKLKEAVQEAEAQAKKAAYDAYIAENKEELDLAQQALEKANEEKEDCEKQLLQMKKDNPGAALGKIAEHTTTSENVVSNIFGTIIGNRTGTDAVTTTGVGGVGGSGAGITTGGGRGGVQSPSPRNTAELLSPDPLNNISDNLLAILKETLMQKGNQYLKGPTQQSLIKKFKEKMSRTQDGIQQMTETSLFFIVFGMNLDKTAISKDMTVESLTAHLENERIDRSVYVSNLSGSYDEINLSETDAFRRFRRLRSNLIDKYNLKFSKRQLLRLLLLTFGHWGLQYNRKVYIQSFVSHSQLISFGYSSGFSLSDLFVWL